MRSVDRHLNQYLATRVTNVLHELEGISTRTNNQSIKQATNKIRSQLNELVRMESEAYTSLVNRNLSIDPIKIDHLVGVDGELSLNIANLERGVIRMNSKRILNVVGLADLLEIVGEIRKSVGARKRLLEP